MIDLATLRDVWKLPPILSARSPETGTIHQTKLLQTTEACYVLRGYRYSNEDRWRIESEHAVIVYVHECGLPAVPPLPLPSGETILEHAGMFYTLFPFARGQQIKRSDLTSDLSSIMGAFLAQVHQTLRAYPHDHVPSFAFSVDHAATLARIEEIEAIIRVQPQKDEVDRQALARLIQRRTWLASTSPVEMSDFSSLEQQVIHGDYQESNVFFLEAQISAIIDWDWTYPAPRAWEVVRALHYLFGFEVEKSRTFLASYRRVLPLSSEDLEVAASVYAWIREHDLWLYEELYGQGNQRVRPFIRPGNFVPLAQRWASLQPMLS